MSTNCFLSQGYYTIKNKDGLPVVLEGNKVVVVTSGNPQVFFFEKFTGKDRCSYVIVPKDRTECIDYTEVGWKLDLDNIHRNWTVTHISGDVYTLTPSGSGHGWTDPGAGTPRQLYLDNTGVPPQHFRIDPA